jgi:hypothetical protein
VSLVESVHAWVMANLPYDRSDTAIVAALNAKSPGEVLVLYLSWNERLVSAVPRQVLRSSNFDSNPIVIQRSATVARIIDDIAQGRDLSERPPAKAGGFRLRLEAGLGRPLGSTATQP